MPTIQAHSTTDQRPYWILETHKTAYAFGIDQRGYLQHMYWGAKLPQASDYGTPDTIRMAASFDRLTLEELSVWGDYKFNEPGLKVRFQDGVRAGLLEYEGAAIEGDHTLIVSLKDPHYPLRVRLSYRVIAEFDLIERSVSLENFGSEAIEIEQSLSAIWHLPRRDSYQLRSLNGRWGSEFQIQNTDLPMGKQIIERRRGSTGFDSNPFFALTPDHATTETQGEVWFGALAFSGNYKLVIERNAFEQVTVSGGIHDFDFLWKLDAGETFTTPVFVGGYTELGFGEASRQLHGYQIGHVLPTTQVRPVIYNSWYVTEFDVNFENQMRGAYRAAELGVELFMMDDGWFGQRNHDRAGLGDWYVNKEKFPEGLGPLIRAIKDLGMDFGIWVEPEMVNPDSDLYRAHPDWTYHFPTRPRSLGRNQEVLNVSRPDVQEYIIGFLDELLGQNNISYVKWDMNRHFSEPGWPDAPAGRDREIWVRHTQGVYNVFRHLREKYPHVVFESCSGGGGRVDMGIMPYIEHFWMSDNTDALDDLFIQEGFTQVYAPLTRLMLVTDPININAHRPIPLQFRLHMAMCGVIGIGADIVAWSEEDMALTRDHVAIYKQIRETVQLGKLYRLRSPRESELSAVQFVRGSEAVVFAFLRASQFGAFRTVLHLQGLEPNAQYQITETGEVFSGQMLMKRGLPLALNGSFVSQMIRLERISG
jgi:alpha-galactosidase